VVTLAAKGSLWCSTVEAELVAVGIEHRSTCPAATGAQGVSEIRCEEVIDQRQCPRSRG